MVRWLAPILSFTAEEVWRSLPGERAESVFLAQWHELPAVPPAAIDWDTALALRADVARELEQLRAAGTIGAPLEAEIDVYCSGAVHRALAAFGDELRFLLITSAARLHEASAAPEGAVPAPGVAGGGVWIRAQRSSAGKCVRCWHLRADVGSDAAHPELCQRCVGNLQLPGETRSVC
jgi:isoleucyl-tRNA synthetase